MDLQYKPLTVEQINDVIALYIDYYNTVDGGEWTKETTYKRIHQVWSREDAMCLILEDKDTILGFCMGYFSTYFDLTAYDLVEILIFGEHQNKGLGTAFMKELERRVTEKGGAMIQLESLNDAWHSHFYGKLGYQDCTNLVLKSKFL